MRKILLALALLSPLFFFNQCRKVQKNVQDYYPKVETSGVKVEMDGSVTVSASILSEGSDPVTFAGFCMDTIPEPKMLSNQQLVDTVFDGKFSYNYKGLKPFTRYYFRSFVTNMNGYAYGNVVSLDNVQIDTSLFLCSAAKDTLKLITDFKTSKFEFYTVTAPQGGGLEWEVRAQTDEYTLTFTFDDFPMQGIYTISDGGGAGDQFVKVEIYGPATGYGTMTLKGGTKFYVRSVDDKHLEYSFCGAKFFDGIDYTVEAKVVSPVK